jgi:hypothetical protein
MSIMRIGGSTIPIARAAAQASGRRASLFLPIFHMYLTKNKNIKPVCPGFKILLGPPMIMRPSEIEEFPSNLH